MSDDQDLTPAQAQDVNAPKSPYATDPREPAPAANAASQPGQVSDPSIPTHPVTGEPLPPPPGASADSAPAAAPSAASDNAAKPDDVVAPDAPKDDAPKTDDAPKADDVKGDDAAKADVAPKADDAPKADAVGDEPAKGDDSAKGDDKPASDSEPAVAPPPPSAASVASDAGGEVHPIVDDPGKTPPTNVMPRPGVAAEQAANNKPQETPDSIPPQIPGYAKPQVDIEAFIACHSNKPDQLAAFRFHVHSEGMPDTQTIEEWAEVLEAFNNRSV